jgi:hypothetical protein
VEEQEVRGMYGLTSSEPNILFGLRCGIRSSPAVSKNYFIYLPQYLFLETGIFHLLHCGNTN